AAESVYAFCQLLPLIVQVFLLFLRNVPVVDSEERSSNHFKCRPYGHFQMVIESLISAFSRPFCNVQADGVDSPVHLRPEPVVFMAWELGSCRINLPSVLSCQVPDIQAFKPKWHASQFLSGSSLTIFALSGHQLSAIGHQLFRGSVLETWEARNRSRRLVLSQSHIAAGSVRLSPARTRAPARHGWLRPGAASSWPIGSKTPAPSDLPARPGRGTGPGAAACTSRPRHPDNRSGSFRGALPATARAGRPRS